jgi:hypothetical protein
MDYKNKKAKFFLLSICKSIVLIYKINKIAACKFTNKKSNLSSVNHGILAGGFISGKPVLIVSSNESLLKARGN